MDLSCLPSSSSKKEEGTVEMWMPFVTGSKFVCRKASTFALTTKWIIPVDGKCPGVGFFHP